jgi:hypothetical protein
VLHSVLTKLLFTDTYLEKVLQVLQSVALFFATLSIKKAFQLLR